MEIAGGAVRSHRIAYSVKQPRERRFRCPVWLPVAPSGAALDRVRVRVELPPGTTPLGSYFPLFNWSGSVGEAVLANVPSFVRAPFAAPGQAVPWLERVGTTRMTDLVALGILIVATIAWAVVRRRR